MIFITFLTLFALYSADHSYSQFSQGPDKCCSSFSNVRIPLKQIESYHTTHLECHRSGIIFITKALKEICADPNERWVQRLKNLVDNRYLKETLEDFAMRWEISFPEPKQRSTPESKPEPKTAPVSEPETESEQELMPAPVLEPEPKPVLESEKEPEPKMAPVPEPELESEQEPKPTPVLEPEPKLKPESEPEPESIGTERTPCQRLALEKVSMTGTTQLRLESPAHEQSHLWSTQFCRRHENN